MKKSITSFDERITERRKDNIWERCASSYAMAKKLCEYEDLEDAGHLFYLPVKPGDTVYVLDADSDIIPLLITQIQIVKNLSDELEIVVCFGNYPYMPVEYYGEMMFSTLKEAEAAKNNLGGFNEI